MVGNFAYVDATWCGAHLSAFLSLSALLSLSPFPCTGCRSLLSRLSSLPLLTLQRRQCVSPNHRPLLGHAMVPQPHQVPPHLRATPLLLLWHPLLEPVIAAAEREREREKLPIKTVCVQCKYAILRVGWLRMLGFRVALPNSDVVDSSMVKNGLYSNQNYICQELPISCYHNLDPAC